MSEGSEVPPVRVPVADDDASIRRLIARLLSEKASIELVGMAVDAEEAVELGSRTHPDVALVDVNMPKGGVRAARELHECSPDTEFVALSGHSDRDGVLEMVSSGAVGYLVKGANVDVVQGMSQETASRVFEPYFTTKDPGSGTGLGLSTVCAIVSRYGAT